MAMAKIEPGLFAIGATLRCRRAQHRDLTDTVVARGPADGKPHA
jgi:hypothetical protein